MNRTAFHRFVPVARRIVGIYGAALAIILYTPITDWLAYPLISKPQVPSGDAIIALSAWANVNGELNESGLRRAFMAGQLYRRGIARVVVVTGSRPQLEEEGDALQAAFHVLIAVGVPPASIIIEGESTNTHESAVHIAQLARARGWTRLVLVTDATHMLRARLAFAHERVQVSTEPTMTWMIEGDRPSIRLAKLGSIVHEYGGLLYYRVRGWI